MSVSMAESKQSGLDGIKSLEEWTMINEKYTKDSDSPTKKIEKKDLDAFIHFVTKSLSELEKNKLPQKSKEEDEAAREDEIEQRYKQKKRENIATLEKVFRNNPKSNANNPKIRKEGKDDKILNVMMYIVMFITIAVLITMVVEKLMEIDRKNTIFLSEKLKPFTQIVGQLDEMSGRLDTLTNKLPEVQDYFNSLSEIMKNFTNLKTKLADSLRIIKK